MSNTFNAAVPGFRPSKHSFKFTNSFKIKDIPIVGKAVAKKMDDAGYGLCGGLAHCVHELFLHKESIPNISKPPKPNTAMYAYLLSGQMDSFGRGLRDMKKILKWHKMPNGKTRLPRLTKAQLVGLKIQLRRGKLAQLMICYKTENQGSPWKNHQVLAYKIKEKNNKGTIWLYEPNNPRNDKARIEYTIDVKGVHMLEYNFGSRAKATETKTIHGFFLINPPLENPLTKPAYLISKGAQFFITHMRKVLRKSIFEIARGLVKYTTLSPLDIIKLLKKAGYNAVDIARISKDVLKLSVEISLSLLLKAQFTVGQVVGAMHIVFKKAASWLVPKLLGLGCRVMDVAEAIQKHFRLPLVDLIKLLKRAGVGLRTIVDILRRTFRINNFRTLAKMLRAAAFGIEDIISELKRGGLSLKDAVIILRKEFRTSVLSAARILKKFFGNKAKDILLTLSRHGDARVRDLISVGRNVFSWGLLKLRRLF